MNVIPYQVCKQFADVCVLWFNVEYCRVDAATIEDPVLRNMRKKDKYAAMVDDMDSLGADSIDEPVRESKSVSE